MNGQKYIDVHARNTGASGNFRIEQPADYAFLSRIGFG